MPALQGQRRARYIVPLRVSKGVVAMGSGGPKRGSRRGGEGVGEVVGVLAVGDDDVHRAGKTGQLAGTGVRHDGDGQLKGAAGHGAAVLEHEGAAAALERSSDALDGDVAGGALDGGAGGQHL